MNEHKTETAEVRRWTIEVSRLRERAARAKRQRAMPGEDTSELVESCLTACQMLLQEFAAADLRASRTERDMQAINTSWRALFERVPVPCLEVNVDGTVIGANTAAGKLLNTSPRRLEGRPLLYFFEDRATVANLLQAAPFEPSSSVTPLVVRPRERAPIRVDATVARADDNAPVCWWFLMPGQIGRRLARPAHNLEQSA
jgi:PAS domain-containing protein